MPLKRSGSRHTSFIDLATREQRRSILLSADSEASRDRMPLVSMVILRHDHPHPTLPHRGAHRGGGLSFARASDLPNQIVISVERHYTREGVVMTGADDRFDRRVLLTRHAWPF